MKMLVSKRVIAVFVAGIAAFAVWGGFAVVDFIETQRMGEVLAAIGEANATRAKQGHSLQATENYVATLQAIDRSALKPDLRAAFEAYVSGFEEAIVLLKDGQSTAPADAKITAAHREMIAIAKRYE